MAASSLLSSAIYVICIAHLISGQANPSDYPNNVPGTCPDLTFFDCGANNGGCIPFSDVRNCVNNCKNGIDELCGTGNILCDNTLPGNSSCGICVAPTATYACLDRRYARLCTEPDVFKCVNTMNCVYDEWLLDGSNDCGDWSDEDNCTLKDPCSANANCTFDVTSSTIKPNATCACSTGFTGDGFSCSLLEIIVPTTTTTTALITTPTTTSTSTSTSTSTTTTPTTTSTSTTTTPTTTTTTPTTTTTTTPSTTSTSTTTTTPTTTSTSTTTTPTTTTTTTSTTTTTTTSVCVGMFTCLKGGCVPDSEVLNGIVNCPFDTSDETYCSTNLLQCPAPPSPQQCAYSVATHSFACGCADPLTVPNQSRYCVPDSSLPNDCTDVIMANISAVTGPTLLYEPSCLTPSNPICQFTAYCDQITLGGGWTQILHRTNTTVNFNRNFSDYKMGIGNASNSDFYLGNEIVFRLTTKKQYFLAVVGEVQTTSVKFFVQYLGFNLSSGTGYQLYVGNTGQIVGTLTNGLLPFNGQNFSAYDEGPLSGCAASKEGGWWWSSSCDVDGALTVPLAADNFDANVKGVFWGGQQLSAMLMMIRPSNYQVPPGKDPTAVGGNGNTLMGVAACLTVFSTVLFVF